MDTLEKYERLVQALILIWNINIDSEDIDVVIYDALESTGDLPEGISKWWIDN